MAENKKSFVAYADWKDTFDKLPDEVAGKLIKHIFAYVNDENPVSEDFVIEAVFSNIKNTLKRDLKKWESQLEQRRNAGKKSAEQRALTKSNERSISLNEKQRNSTVSVSDSVSVNDILLKKETKVNITERKKIFYDSLIPFSNTYDKTMLRDFYEYWTEHGENDLKFRKEKEKTFGLDRRLKTWSTNNFNKQQNGKSKITERPEFKQITNAIKSDGIRR